MLTHDGGFSLSNARHCGDAGFPVRAAPKVSVVPDAGLAGIAGDAGNVCGCRGWKFLYVADFHFEQLKDGWSTMCHSVSPNTS
jgi:hypothetical protein